MGQHNRQLHHVVMIIAILFSLVAGAKGGSIISIVNSIGSSIAPSISAVFILGYFWKRGTKEAAKITFAPEIGEPPYAFWSLIDKPENASKASGGQRSVFPNDFGSSQVSKCRRNSGKSGGNRFGNKRITWIWTPSALHKSIQKMGRYYARPLQTNPSSYNLIGSRAIWRKMVIAPVQADITWTQQMEAVGNWPVSRQRLRERVKLVLRRRPCPASEMIEVCWWSCQP